jgi:hypothetical protein
MERYTLTKPGCEPMLIILPSTPTTENASRWLEERGVPHRLIPIPESLGYRTGADIAIYVPGNDASDVPAALTRARFVVMRVFKDFQPEPSETGESEDRLPKNATEVPLA